MDAGGIRAAARQLSVSPATVVDHLDRLERDLDASLIVRRRAVVRLTPQGAAFAPLARALVTTAQQAQRLIATVPLRVAASSNVGTYIVLPLIAAFEQSQGCHVELWLGSNPDVADRLSTGAADLALMEWWDHRPGFTAHEWRQEPLMVIVSPNHPWATRSAIAPTELAQERILGGERGSGTGTLLRGCLGETFHQLQIVPGFGSTEGVKRGVRAGLGISIVVASSVTDEIAAGHLVSIPLDGLAMYKSLWLITPISLSGPVTQLANFLLHRIDFLNIATHSNQK